jgi:6-pyruvoyltetrahydropterin/6-carboxytetrahydropterin synthase
MKRAKTKIDGMSPKEWMDYMFDHTIIVAADDPYINTFQQLDNAGLAQVRIVPATGAEKFAEYIYNKLSKFVYKETEDRVTIKRVEFMEHNKNTAIYEH